MYSIIIICISYDFVLFVVQSINIQYNTANPVLLLLFKKGSPPLFEGWLIHKKDSFFEHVGNPDSMNDDIKWM